MTSVQASGTFKLGTRTVHRLGYGAMQLAGPGVFGPPRDREAAVRVVVVMVVMCRSLVCWDRLSDAHAASFRRWP